MYESLSKNQIHACFRTGKEDQRLGNKDAKKPEALGGQDKFTGEPADNVSPMQHNLHKKDNYIVA